MKKLQQHYISRRLLIVLIMCGLLAGTLISITQKSEAACCTCCQESLKALATAVASAFSIEEIWQKQLEEWVNELTAQWSQDNSERQVQSEALSMDSVNKNAIDIQNADMAYQLRSAPERCTTEAVGLALMNVDDNQRLLIERLNKKEVELILAGETKPVAKAKADVERAGQDGEYAGLDTIIHITNPKKPYDTDKERGAARAYVERLAESVSLPPVPKNNKQTNKGLLYKKSRLDYMATVQLVKNSFNQAIAQNTSQTGLLNAMKQTIDSKDDFAMKLLQDMENKDLSAASKNTLLHFELRRRFSKYWQSKVQDLSDSAVNKEINTLLIMKNYTLREEFALNMRSELILAAMLAQELKDSDDFTRLQALYADLN